MKTLKHKIDTAFDRKPFPAILILAFLLTIILELLGHVDSDGFLAFAFHHPLVLLSNILIVLATLSITLLVRRRVFCASVVSVLWLGFGITNMLTILLRGTPFSARDLLLLYSFILVADVYFKPWQIVGIIAVLIGLVVGFIFLFRKGHRAGKPAYGRSLLLVAAIAVLTAGGCFYMARSFNLHSDFSSINEAYSICGFPYCFTNSIFNKGIGRPEGYSQETVDTLVESIERDNEGNLPNIIFVQLESFIDPSEINGISFETDPVPNFNRLCAQYPSGYLEVPTIGGATVNTEFEILCGMDISYFGLGEYPYESVLKDTPCESLATTLTDAGLFPQAIHNHSGSFYDRNIVYSNLGFRTFTSVEYMRDLTYNSCGWAEDSVLTDCIASCLSYSSGRDFIMAVSVQAHGGYPDDPDNDNPNIILDDEHENAYPGLDYYVGQLSGTDRFIGALVDYLSSYPEPTVVVFYGDHLPAMHLADEDMRSGSNHKTEYVIWSNTRISGRDMDLEAYRLGSRVFQLLDFDGGLLPSYHREYYGTDDYEKKLELLQYDMLYGQQAAYEGNPPKATELQMGLHEISILKLDYRNDLLYVLGVGFTPYSVVYINGKSQDTDYLNSGLLTVSTDIGFGDSISVVQLASDRVILSETNSMVYGHASN